jgi:hypothetical protein
VLFYIIQIFFLIPYQLSNIEDTLYLQFCQYNI